VVLRPVSVAMVMVKPMLLFMMEMIVMAKMMMVTVLHAGFLELQQAGAALYLQCTGFSLQRLPLLQSMGSRSRGFRSSGTGA